MTARRPRGNYVDWDKTNKQVERATRKSYKGKTYIPSKSVADHINMNRDQFSQFRDLSYASVLLRTTRSMKKMNWRVWGSSGKRGTVFVAPWAEK